MLELGDRPEDVEEHPADGGRGVDPLVKHDEVDAAALEPLGELDQVLERAAESVEFGDHELVAGAVGCGERFVELGASRELPGGRVDEGLVAAGGRERVVLRLGMLIAG